MALISSYLVTTKNLHSFFNSLMTAQAPDTFTQKFLESLEFKSTNDRLFIGLMRGLGFLDATNKPTAKYFEFIDQTQSKRILAGAIKEAYADLFAVNTKANELSVNEIKNKLKTLTQGKNTDNVLRYMANTFKSLVEYAEWAPANPGKGEPGKDSPVKDTHEGQREEEAEPGEDEVEKKSFLGPKAPQLHYNIQIHLPESRDPAVYDTLLKSLRKHLF